MKGTSAVAAAPAEAAGLITCLAAAALFWLFSRPRTPHRPGYSKSVFLLVLAAGTLARWVLAWHTPGNYDRESWQIAADVFSKGGNIYLESARYHYSPVWFWLLGALKAISQSFPVISFSVAVRLFLTLVDIATAVVLWRWPKLSEWERARQASFFFLNPVSFLLTGVHGQFENLSILFILLGMRLAVQPVLNEAGHRRAWVWGTVALVVKQNLMFGLVILTRHLFPRMRAMRLLLTSLAVFFILLLPYWREAEREIVKNVFLYRSHAAPFGFSSLDIGILAPVFAAALLAYAFTLHNRRLSTKMLACALFFLTFTTGFGVQYLVLPVAFAALRPTRGFFAFSLVAGAHLLGSYFNLGLPAFAWIQLWVVWAVTAVWWWSVHTKAAKTA